VEANPSQAVALVTSSVSATIGHLITDATNLAQLGARTLIVPNVPELGNTPDYNTSALGIELGDAFSNLHNAALPGAMESVHNATGTNIIVLNVAQLLNNAVANPALYGFSNATQACIDVSSCVNGSTATQNSYVFWDGVHPTTHSQYLIARYAAASLNQFEALSIPGQIGTQSALDFNGLLDGRMDALRAGASGLSYNIDGASGGHADPDQKLGVFISAGGGFGNRANSDEAIGYGYRDAVTAIGVDYRFTPNIMAGIALGYGDNHADVNYGGTVHQSALDVGMYALGQWSNAYVTFAGSYGHGWYNTQAPGVIGNGPVGKPTGDAYALDLFGGYLFPVLPAVNLGPQAGLTYTNTGLGAYTQSGDPLLTQSVDSQGYEQVIATTAAVASGQWQCHNVVLSPYARIGAQILLSGRNSKFTSAFTDEPVVTLTSTYPKEPPAWAIFTFGANAAISDQLSASASLETTGFKSDGNNLLLSAGLRYAF
jgi:outer membrane lipase/esterase